MTSNYIDIMDQALVEHVELSIQNRRAKSPQSYIPDMPTWFQPENILDGIHVYRVHDEAAQTATIFSLPEFLKKRVELGVPVRLIVVDSIAFHYRVSGILNTGRRNYLPHKYFLFYNAVCSSRI